MDLMGLLFGRKSPTRRPRPPQSDVTVPTYGMILIDMPNVIYRGFSETEKSSNYINWEILTSKLERLLAGTIPVRRATYHTVERGSETGEAWEIRAIPKWEEEKYSLIINRKKDVDSFIINDLWQSVAEILEKSKEAFVHIVLISGDGGYLRTIDSIAKTYGSRLRLQLTVCSWRDSLSGELRKRADHVELLDRIPGLRKNRT